MPKGFSGMPPNMNNLMKQAKKMQEQMENATAELETKQLTASAGGGAVKVTITGKKQIQSITIDPAAVDPEDVDMLQDLIVSAVNEALRQVEDMVNKEMGKFMPSGMGGLAGGLF